MSASAHPETQGGLDVTIHADRVLIHARVTLEEVKIASSSAGDDPLPGPWAATGAAAFDRHAAYLARHLHVLADGKELTGRVVTVREPKEGAAVAPAEYDLEYPMQWSQSPRKVELTQDVLKDARFAPGQAAEASYIVGIGQTGHPSAEGLLLTWQKPLTYACNWNGAGLPPGVEGARGLRMFHDYVAHGVHHILGGYDHLLFISALVLAATTLWDLVKVVTAFTLAHTLTLTLAALNLVHLPEKLVEPLIAASIVFVAAQNVFWPHRSRGWLRLGAAFFFGLFHGLGFAGGLLDAMQGMRGAVVLLAIVSFSIGVELGHQFVVIPLFSAIKLARRTLADEAAKERLSLRVQRFGSAAISLAGLFYLWGALR
jgi:hypothetical protein